MDRRKCTRLRRSYLLIIALFIGFILGIILMVIVSKRWRTDEEEVNSISNRIMEEILADNIRENLRETTKKPHVAGTEGDWQSAEDLRTLWLRQGFDSAKLVSYDVLLQYPPLEKGKENRVQIVNEDGEDPIFEAALRPDTFGEPDLEQDGILPPYHAYSGVGDVMGDPVYVNYGRREDIEFLQKNLTPGINFTGKVFICRRGAILYKVVDVAQSVNAAAIIMFPDPIDYAVYPSREIPYPNGKFIPASAPVWGSILYDIGDPLTPGYPAVEGAFRISEDEVKFAKIPVHPIGYGDAQKILSMMTGPAPPEVWGGHLNVTYQVGPGFKGDMKSRKVRVFVNSTMHKRRTYNTIGFIRGQTEPDRYVIIGNHRDAWGLGAVDPTGGTAVMMEISRVFGKLKTEGWTPRRTLVFASWGAEEFALAGSVEWTEQFHNILSARTLAYLNLDIAVVGTYMLKPSTSPLLVKAILKSAQQVKDPHPSETRETLYDSWVERWDSNPEQMISILDGGSDFEGFVYGLGIPSVNAYFMPDWNKDSYFYSLYHTQYETFRLVDEFVDPDFLCHRAMGQFFAQMLLNLGDCNIVQSDVMKYAYLVQGLSKNLRSMFLDQIMENTYRNITLDYLYMAVEDFILSAQNFQYTILPGIDEDDALAVRGINDQMMSLERTFLSRERFPGKNVYRHQLLAPTFLYDTNDFTFPGMMFAMHNIMEDPNQKERWENVERQLSIITHVIGSAASVLKDVTSW